MQKTSIFGILGKNGQFRTVFGQNGRNGIFFFKKAFILCGNMCFPLMPPSPLILDKIGSLKIYFTPKMEKKHIFQVGKMELFFKKVLRTFLSYLQALTNCKFQKKSN